MSDRQMSDRQMSDRQMSYCWRMPQNSLIEDPKRRSTDKKSLRAQPTILGLLATNYKQNSKRERKSLLGKLSVDLEYLEGLVDEVKALEETESVYSGPEISRRSRKLKNEAEEAVSFLQNRQDFWRQFKSTYRK